jgi:hypothetical protein
MAGTSYAIEALATLRKKWCDSVDLIWLLFSSIIKKNICKYYERSLQCLYNVLLINSLLFLSVKRTLFVFFKSFIFNDNCATYVLWIFY